MQERDWSPFRKRKVFFTKMLLRWQRGVTETCTVYFRQDSSIEVLTFTVQTAKMMLPKLWDHFYFHTDLSLERQRPGEAITQNHCTDNLSCTLNKEILRKPIPLHCVREPQEPKTLGELLSLPRASLEGSILHTHKVFWKHIHTGERWHKKGHNSLTTFPNSTQSP